MVDHKKTQEMRERLQSILLRMRELTSRYERLREKHNQEIQDLS